MISFLKDATWEADLGCRQQRPLRCQSRHCLDSSTFMPSGMPQSAAANTLLFCRKLLSLHHKCRRISPALSQHYLQSQCMSPPVRAHQWLTIEALAW